MRFYAGIALYLAGIQNRGLTVIIAFGLAVILMLVPTAYAMDVSVASDRVGDGFIMNALTGEVVKYVARGDVDYVSFVDLVNVRIRLSEETMRVALQVLGEIPSGSAEDVYFGFGLVGGPSEDSFTGGLTPTEYPWFVVQVTYRVVPTPRWESWMYVAMTPNDAILHFDIPFTIGNRQVAVSVPASLLPMTAFGWRGLTSFQNTTSGDFLTLTDLTDVNSLS